MSILDGLLVPGFARSVRAVRKARDLVNAANSDQDRDRLSAWRTLMQEQPKIAKAPLFA